MAQVPSYTLTEASTREVGPITKCRGKDVSTINLGNWHTTDSGWTINFQDKEYSITSILRFLRDHTPLKV